MGLRNNGDEAVGLWDRNTCDWQLTLWSGGFCLEIRAGEQIFGLALGLPAF